MLLWTWFRWIILMQEESLGRQRWLRWVRDQRTRLFLDGTPNVASALMKSEPLTCKLSWLSTETLHVGCSAFPSLCSDTARGADGGIIYSPVSVVPSVCGESWEGTARKHTGILVHKPETRQMHWPELMRLRSTEAISNEDSSTRTSWHFPCISIRWLCAIRGAILQTAKPAGLILQGAEGFPRSTGCQQPSPAKCGWWDPQRHLTPEDYFNPIVDLTTYPGEAESWAGRTFPIAVRAISAIPLPL